MNVAEKTYCESSFFERVLANKNKKEKGVYGILYRFLSKQCDIVLDMEKTDFLKLCKEKPLYKQLFKRANLSFRAIPTWKENVDFSDNVDKIYLYDSKTRKECEKIREAKGCLAISGEEQDVLYFERLGRVHYFNLVPKSDQIEDKNITYHNSWEEFFATFKLPPLNAIIISDNFLFGDKFQQRKERSLYAILKAMAPKDLKEDLHITIFAENSNSTLTKERAQEVIAEIKALGLNKNTKVTIVAHTIKSTTHDRKIVTNYDYLQSGVGFNVIDESGVEEIAIGQEQSITGGLDSPVTVRLLQVQQVQWLKDIFEKKKGMNVPCAFIVGDKINRLFLDQ